MELGLRIGEVCGLKWSDIDTKSKILTVQRTVSRIYLGKNNTRVEISTPKTRSSARQLPIPEKLFPMLRQLKNCMPTTHGFYPETAASLLNPAVIAPV